MNRRTALSYVLAVLACCAIQAHADDGSAVAVRDAWARATPPGSTVAAVYVTLVGGTQDDELVAARTQVAAMTMIHSITESDGVSRMRETSGVAIPAGGRVVLAPRGTHIMLMNLARPLAAGERFDVELTFAHSARRVVSVSVLAPDQAAPVTSDEHKHQH